MQEDAILVKHTLSGDEEVFHSLVRKYQASIYALIRSWVDNIDDAQELTQEIFLEAFRDLHLLKQPERFYAWLCQIARHRCQDWQRKNNHSIIPLDESMPVEALPADELLALDEILSKMMKAVDELPELDRELLKAHYLDDTSYAELQVRHKLSYKGVTNRILRAKQKVRERLMRSFLLLPWQDITRKLFIGVEAVKISVKVKIITGVCVLLALSGTCVVVWHSQESSIKVLGSPVSQVNQGKVSANHTNLPSSSKDNPHKLTEKQKDEQADKIISWLRVFQL